MHKFRNDSKGESNPGYIDCDSGILPRSTVCSLILLDDGPLSDRARRNDQKMIVH